MRWALLVAVLCVACGVPSRTGSNAGDAGMPDAGPADAGAPDGGVVDDGYCTGGVSTFNHETRQYDCQIPGCPDGEMADVLEVRNLDCVYPYGDVTIVPRCKAWSIMQNDDFQDQERAWPVPDPEEEPCGSWERHANDEWPYRFTR